MEKAAFERLLDGLTEHLNAEIKATGKFANSKAFENAARHALELLGKEAGVRIDFNPHPYAFPDIVIGEFGIEVKFSDKDTWRSVANSVFEGHRSSAVKHIYLLFGKMGGTPEVKWAGYADSVIHVRTSHVPRFEVEIAAKTSLFTIFGRSYDEFQTLKPEEKMEYIRTYARSRLKEGERLWWLESGNDDEDHTLPIQARLFTSLSSEKEKRQYRAEAALICPSLVGPSRARKKYDDATLYLMTYRGILCTQIRDLFSAGSVALKADSTRGGNYIERSLRDIEAEMVLAANTMDDAVILEYWGSHVPPENRIAWWLEKADKFAKGVWVPSKSLFQKR